MMINNRDIELDPEGYLIHPEDWDHDVANELANSENIELADDYWTVFDFMRKFYDENGVAPDVRHTTKQMVVDFGVDKKSCKSKIVYHVPIRLCQAGLQSFGYEAPKRLEYWVIFSTMKLFLFKFSWAFFWLFFGLMIAQSSQIFEPVWIALIMLLTLLVADALKLTVRKIKAHLIST